MTNSSILVDVCGAIEFLDGVSIVDSFIHSDGARIEFTVTDSFAGINNAS